MVINMADTAYISEGSQSHSQLGWTIHSSPRECCQINNKVTGLVSLHVKPI